MGVKHRISCVSCGHEWQGRIRLDEEASATSGASYVVAVDAAKVQRMQLVRQLKASIDASLLNDRMPYPAFSVMEWKVISSALAEIAG